MNSTTQPSDLRHPHQLRGTPPDHPGRRLRAGLGRPRGAAGAVRPPGPARRQPRGHRPPRDARRGALRAPRPVRHRRVAAARPAATGRRRRPPCSAGPTSTTCRRRSRGPTCRRTSPPRSWSSTSRTSPRAASEPELPCTRPCARRRAAAEARGRRRAPAPDAALRVLTPRECDILELIVAGMSNREISDELSLSLNSVKTYIRTAYRKMGVAAPHPGDALGARARHRRPARGPGRDERRRGCLHRFFHSLWKFGSGRTTRIRLSDGSRVRRWCRADEAALSIGDLADATGVSAAHPAHLGDPARVPRAAPGWPAGTVATARPTWPPYAGWSRLRDSGVRLDAAIAQTVDRSTRRAAPRDRRVGLRPAAPAPTRRCSRPG